MSRPKRIFLVRHGESEANVAGEVYTQIPDHKIPLTSKGYQQAREAGKFINEEITKTLELNQSSSEDSVLCRVYCSPFTRSRQTFEGMAEHFQFSYKYSEDPRLREQEWGNYQRHYDPQDIHKERDEYGTFFYRIPQGESGADVYDRITLFMDSMYRDFQKESFPENVLLISHGLTIRIFLMRWFHWTPERFETLANLRNGQVVEMRCDHQKGKYELVTPLHFKS